MATMSELWREFNNINVRDYQILHPALFSYVKEAMATPGKQYLLIGDTNHSDIQTRQFLNSPALVALFNHAAIPHVAIEVPREIAPPERIAEFSAQSQRPETADKAEEKFWKDVWTDVKKFAGQYEIARYSDMLRGLNGEIGSIKEAMSRGRMIPALGQDEIARLENEATDLNKQYWDTRLSGFASAGLHVTAADSWQWMPFLVPGSAERVWLGDREVAAYIAKQAQGDKTAILYGTGHFQYDGGLATHIGRENSVYIDIYADREAYRCNALFHTGRQIFSHRSIHPSRIYLLLRLLSPVSATVR